MAGTGPGEVIGNSPPTLESDDYAIQRALLAAIVASSDDAIVSKTLDGRIQSWNAGAERIFGYSASEAVGKPITLIIPAYLRDEEKRILQQLRRGERIDHFDTMRLSKDGRLVPISLTVSPVRDSQGTIIGASKVARDISDRRRAEQSSRDSERLLAAHASALARLHDWSTRLWRSNTLGDGLEEILTAVVALVESDKGTIQLLDPKSAALSIVAQKGFDQNFLDFYRQVDATDESARGRAFTSGQRVIIEDTEADAAYASLRHIARAADYRSVTSTPLVSADGEPLGIISTYCRSVHRPSPQELHLLDLYLRQAGGFIQRCKMDESLRKSEEALREADRKKDEFLALLAHELRNPLAPIRYALAANRKAERTPEQRKRAEEIIERQVTHMSHLLDDLLDVSRITRGTLELKRSATELTSVIGAAIETARPLLDGKHHNLSLDLPKEAVRLNADAVRLAQVFSNLLINAAKYTDAHGHIHLRAMQQGNDIVVSVRDDGIGISEEMKPRLFTMFAQAKSALERAEGGLGIGLSLVRGLVTLHGGTVDAHSDGPGRGSEFVVRLPPGPQADETAGARPDAATMSSGLGVLVVDDNRDAADTLALLLEVYGHRVQTAYTALHALDCAERLRPQVLLLDIGLPDLDGYELARRIRGTPWGRKTILVAITGWGQEEDRRRAIQAGFNYHLTKPVAAEALEALLQKIARDPASGRASDAPHLAA